MHPIDRLELADTLSKLRLEANLLATERVPGNRLVRLRRMDFLLRYLAEHLEMLSGTSAAVQREVGTAFVAGCSGPALAQRR